MWKRSKERNTVFAKYMFKIFLRELFSFSSTRSHQGFIASIYLVHFHHIIRTFYKCHKCVTSNKLFSLGFVWYYLQKETPLDRYTVKKKKVYETVNLIFNILLEYYCWQYGKERRIYLNISYLGYNFLPLDFILKIIP